MADAHTTSTLLAGALVFFLWAGCTPPPEAPTDLDDLSVYMFREFESDEEVLAAGLHNLDVFLTGLDCWGDFEMGKDRGDREWTLQVLQGDDLGGVDPPPGADPEGQTRVGVAAISQHPVVDHGEMVALADQSPAQTSSSVVYDREFLTDVDCFVDQTCDRVETYNTVQRQILMLDVTYEQYKDFRWIELPDGGGIAMLARSWVEERFEGADEDQALEQSFTAEVWLPHPDGSMLYIANWVEWTIPGITDEDMIASMTASGIDEMFEAYEAYLDGDAG